MNTTPKTVGDWADAVKAANVQCRAPSTYAWDLAFRLHARHPGATIHVEDGIIEVWHEGGLDHLTSGWERVSA